MSRGVAAYRAVVLVLLVAVLFLSYESMKIRALNASLENHVCISFERCTSLLFSIRVLIYFLKPVSCIPLYCRHDSVTLVHNFDSRSDSMQLKDQNEKCIEGLEHLRGANKAARCVFEVSS